MEADLRAGHTRAARTVEAYASDWRDFSAWCRAVGRGVLRGARVAVVARGLEAPVRAAGAREVAYLPNFATSAIEPRRSQAETRARLGVPADAFLMTYSGSLGYKQDFANVIAAAERLAGESDIRLLVVGEGVQQAMVQEAFDAGRVRGRWLPLQSVDEVPEVLAASDVLLAPQRATEVDMSIPSKLTAYLAAERPVLAAASAGSETARQVEESGGGIVVPPADPAALAAAMRALRNDPVGRARMGASGRAFALATFDRGRAEARFVAWAEALVARRSYVPPG